MVESGTRLREALALVPRMGVQADAHRPVRLAEHDGVTLPIRMRLVHELGQLEDVAVPGHAALEVADGDGHVVDSGELRHGPTVRPVLMGGNGHSEVALGAATRHTGVSGGIVDKDCRSPAPAAIAVRPSSDSYNISSRH